LSTNTTTPSPDDEKVRLLSIFTSTTKKELIKYLYDKVKNADDAWVLRCAGLFPASDFPIVAEDSHCVRCHQSYDKQYNGKRACKVEHADTFKKRDPPKGSQWCFSCCSYTWYSENIPFKSSLRVWHHQSDIYRFFFSFGKLISFQKKKTPKNL